MNIKISGSTAFVDGEPVLYQYMQREHFKVKEGVYVSDDMWEEFVKSHQDRFADYASQIAHSMWESFSENFKPTKSKDFEKAWKRSFEGEVTMSWKDILKLQTLEQNVNFDANESCCSQLKTEFSMFIEKLDNYYFEKLGYSKGGMTNHFVRILEEPCEVVVGTILHLIDGVKNPPKGSKFPTWGLAELEKMIDNYEKCIEGE